MQNRIVLHLDMNSYYASVEQQAAPNLRGRPIGVAGKGAGERTVVVGLSIEAKKLGLRGIMSSWEARRLCPSLIIVPANYDRYIFTSQRIFRLLEHYSNKVEIFSIDEAFVELRDCSWEMASQIAQEIKQKIRSQIGGWLRCSIGLSYGKTLAKLASELHKPDGLTLIRPEDFATLAPQIPIENVCGIGYRLTARLKRLGASTLADVAQLGQVTLITVFGRHTGTWLYSISRGIDTPLVRSFHSLAVEKSLSHSYTLPRDIVSRDQVNSVILLLAERVGRRLRHKGLTARTVSLYLRYGDWGGPSIDSGSPRASSRGGWGKQHHHQVPIRDGYHIYQAAQQLGALAEPNRPIRLVNVGVSQLQMLRLTSHHLFTKERFQDQVLSAVDQLNDRYGDLTIHRGTVSAVKRKIMRLPDGPSINSGSPRAQSRGGRNQRLYIPETNPFMKRFGRS